MIDTARTRPAMMATTVSTAKPPTPYHAAAASAAPAGGGKVKRPAALQQQQSSSNAQNGVNVNGVKAQAQVSGANKPNVSKQTTDAGVAVNGVNGKNGVRRKESQKNGDAVARLLRATGRTDGECRGKISPEPCGRFYI